MKRLYKSRNQVMIDGVCGGIAEYLGVDVTIVRIVFVVAALSSVGFAALVYFIGAVIIPRAPLGADEYYEDDPQRRPRE